MSHSPLSIKLTKDIEKDEKKKYGIFFTPQDTIQKNIDVLGPYMSNITDVLEPSCGSCEYINELQNSYDNLNITGIELNKNIFKSIKKLENDKLKLLNVDFIDYQFQQKYDLILGNPPYFVIPKKDLDEYYYDYFVGRPNIFIPFIIKSLDLLKENGILSFVLPKNFLNSHYYDRTRKHIIQNFTILDMFECDDKYIDTSQDTLILILQNKKPNQNANKDYFIEKSSFTVLGTKENIIKLKKLYIDSTTLHSLGFDVKVGKLVWNQNKKDLTNDDSKTLLIYSSDIKNNKLEIQSYKNKDKKNYIDQEGIKDCILVINRGYGKGKYKFNYCIINENENREYLIENHLIFVKYNHAIEKSELINLYKKIIKSLTNTKSKEFVEIYFANNAINTTELHHIFPIYDM